MYVPILTSTVEDWGSLVMLITLEGVSEFHSMLQDYSVNITM